MTLHPRLEGVRVEVTRAGSAGQPLLKFQSGRIDGRIAALGINRCRDPKMSTRMFRFWAVAANDARAWIICEFAFPCDDSKGLLSALTTDILNARHEWDCSGSFGAGWMCWHEKGRFGVLCAGDTGYGDSCLLTSRTSPDDKFEFEAGPAFEKLANPSGYSPVSPSAGAVFSSPYGRGLH